MTQALVRLSNAKTASIMSTCTGRILKNHRRAFDGRKMSITNDTGPYDNAVKMLNSLQSITSKLVPHPGYFKLGQVNTFLNRCSLSNEDLDQLSVIHIAGTKGKGSTCAFCEQLLSNKGYRTGLFTSPHLISVKERFRINGKIISDDKFVSYFWSVHNALVSKQKSGEELPSYFMFLTIMAFKMFVNEKLDVAIIETGIGGEYDCTNVLRNTAIVGITSLGFDHTTVLGNTLQEIAWQKSGIMKPNSVTIVSYNQPKETYKVLIERSVEKQSLLLEAPPFHKYKNTSKLENLSKVQRINVSLAIQLANAWMNRNNSHEWFEKCIVGSNGMKQAPVWEINKLDQEAVRDIQWFGRYQIVNATPNLTYYLDGAHTIESVQLCSKWFLDHYPKSQLIVNLKNILIFNVTAFRDYSSFLKILVTENKIDLVLLCPIITYVNNRRPDTVDVKLNYEEELQKCYIMKNTIDFCQIEVLNSINETIKYIELCSSSEKNTMFRVLVTGSLKLVGGVLEFCKYFLVKFCPHDLFVNTRADLGACPKVHCEEAKTQYNEASSRSKMPYEDEFVSFATSLLNDVERRIEKGKQRLELMNKTEMPVSHSNTQSQKNQEQIKLLSEKINGLVQEAGQMGTEGHVEEAQGLMKLCDKLKEERDALRKQNESIHWSQTYELAAAQEKQMEVCEVCGAFLIVGDAQSRIDDHLMGKQHMGYARLKNAVSELQEQRKKYVEEREKQREEERKKRLERNRSSSKDVDRHSRDADRDRKSKSSRDRSAHRRIDRKSDRHERERRRSRSRDRRHSNSHRQRGHNGNSHRDYY